MDMSVRGETGPAPAYREGRRDEGGRVKLSKFAGFSERARRRRGEPSAKLQGDLGRDTAGYQEELLLYCGEGTDPRFGVIEFAIGADVTEAFRAEVRATAESESKPLIRCVDGKPQQTDQLMG
jgi:hypothetical protein